MATRMVFSVLCVAGLSIPAFTASAANPMADIDRDTLNNLLVAAPGLSRKALEHGLKAARCAAHMNKSSSPLLTIIDYSKRSNNKRLWVLDIERDEVVYNEWVAHGVNSGNATATRFSNKLNSRKSSLGVYRTAETYSGKHGYSLKLDGLDGRYNNRARERAIVIHGASYVDEAGARKSGRVGRSWGCPALRKEVSRKVINTIKGGSLVVAYYPQKDWMRKSAFLNCPAATLPKARKKFTLQVVQGDTNPPQLELMRPTAPAVSVALSLPVAVPVQAASLANVGFNRSPVIDDAPEIVDSIATYEYQPVHRVQVINVSSNGYFSDATEATPIPVVESYALGATLPTGLSYSNDSYGDYSLSGVNDYSYERSLGDVTFDQQSYTGQVNEDGDVVESVAFNEAGTDAGRSSRYLRFSGSSDEEVRSFSFLQ